MARPHPPTEAIHVIRVLQALADETRLAAVVALADPVPKTSTSLAEQLGLTASTVSHHLRILREAGITAVRPQGNLRWTRLRRQDLDTRYPGLLDCVIEAARMDQVGPGDPGVDHPDSPNPRPH